MSRKGGFRNLERRQQVRNKGKFEFRKQQLLLKEQMNQTGNYHENKKNQS
jgi:hypothetical protein|tara:strand:- start:437 stop:586 length:150 start_codon:yes stop_codon:yes gene_type:complete